MKKNLVLLVILLVIISCENNKNKSKDVPGEKSNIESTSLDPVELATYTADSEATKEAEPYVLEIEKNGIKLVSNALVVFIKDKNGKILWQSEKQNKYEVYEERLSENGHYACFQYGANPVEAVFVDTFNGKVHEYVPPQLPHSHELWLSFEVTDEGLAKAIKNEVINGVKTRYEAYIYDFATEKVIKPTDLETKTKGYIYFRTDIKEVDSLDDVLHFAGNLQKNNMLFAEGIKVLEAPKGQEAYWLFTWEGKTKESGGTDVDILYDAIDFFKINKKEYNF